jgi:erythromycin esterase-like protein
MVFFKMQFVRKDYDILLINLIFYSVLLIADAKLPTNELPDYNATQFGALDAIVGSAQFVNFGEPTHSLVGIHYAATRTFRYLVEKKGFRIFVFESAWAVDEAIHACLASNFSKTTPNEQYPLSAFHSNQTIELLL